MALIKKVYQRIHTTSPKLGQAVSLATAATLITGHSFIAGVPLWVIGATKYATGVKVADNAIIAIAKDWIKTNTKLIDTVLPERDWRIEMPEDLDEDKQYLLISNHLSWVDIVVVQYLSTGRLPLTRFFTKRNLIYLPFVGQAFYFLDFPMIKRPARLKLANLKTPEAEQAASASLRDANILEAKRACQLLQDKPFALLNFLEGTRFTQKKHDQQGSPYQHLLKPKAGGITLAIQALGQQIDGILDITIVYPDGSPSYNDLWKGKVKRLGVQVRRLEVPEALFTALTSSNPADSDSDMVRQTMYAWLDEIWQYKDAQIKRMLADFADNPAS